MLCVLFSLQLCFLSRRILFRLRNGIHTQLFSLAFVQSCYLPYSCDPEKRINDVSLDCSTLPIKLSSRFSKRKFELMFFVFAKIWQNVWIYIFESFNSRMGEEKFHNFLNRKRICESCRRRWQNYFIKYSITASSFITEIEHKNLN